METMRGTPAHSREMYTPRPRRRRSGIALCLSGGGFRAVLFHLGALRRLNEVGILTQVRTFTSVSGGSIVAAHLASLAPVWPDPGTPLPDWERNVAAPLRALTNRNLRTVPLARRFFLPWYWFRSGTAVRDLEHAYARHLTSLSLGDLPARPRFVFCSTDMAFGVNWIFDSCSPDTGEARLGDYQVGYAPFPDWPLARAVAASSCCPPFFDPLPLGLASKDLKNGKYRLADRDALIAGLSLTDGGVYDNMGLEPVWKDHECVLVSDGGAVFQQEGDRGLLGRLQRYHAVVDRQSRALRKRWLIAGFIQGAFTGAYWGLGSVVAHYETDVAGYSEDLVTEHIARIRTDFDAFNSAEAAILENHGYLLAGAAVRRHLPHMTSDPTPSLVVPFPRWQRENAVRTALRRSHHRTLLGRW